MTSIQGEIWERLDVNNSQWERQLLHPMHDLALYFKYDLQSPPVAYESMQALVNYLWSGLISIGWKVRNEVDSDYEVVAKLFTNVDTSYHYWGTECGV